MAAITMQMAMNCRTTRHRIKVWLRLGLPPRSMFHSPIRSTRATAASANGTARRTACSINGFPRSQVMAATLVACGDRVEGPGRQQAPEQNRGVSGDRDVIARLRPPALYRVGEFGRDRLRPKLESLAAACLEPHDPRAISLAMPRTFEIDVAAIGLESMLKKARSDRTGLDQRHADASSFELETERIGESLDGEFRGAIGAAVRRRDQTEHGRAEHETPAAI